MITIVKQTQAVKILDKRLEDSKFTQGQENIHIKSLERGNNRRNLVPRTVFKTAQNRGIRLSLLLTISMGRVVK